MSQAKCSATNWTFGSKFIKSNQDIANETADCSGAEIENLCREAALKALRDHILGGGTDTFGDGKMTPTVTMKDIDYAKEKLKERKACVDSARRSLVAVPKALQ